jgi:ABC-type glycerol-3-phosphate transport system substrate-binding protein
MHMKRAPIIVFTLFILYLSACSSNSNSTIILWTDKPEMAAYVEEFNSIQDKYRVEIVYKKDPGNALSLSDIPGDLIVSEYLNSPGTIELFSSLEDLYKENRMDLSIFYSGLLDLGYKQEELLLLPVSFNLPTVMFKKSIVNEDIPPFYMNSTDMETASKNFNINSDAGFEIMGFSPRWESEFLFINAVLMEANFQLLNSGLLSWENQKVLDSLEFSMNWSEEINGGLEQEEDFTTKFLYDPPYKLIEENRILFYYSDLVNFFDIAPEKRKNLDFRWIASDTQIPVFGNILFTGIPEKAKNKKGSIEFIHWFFNPDTQKNLLKSTQIKRLDTFGFANGFSSLPEINNNELAIIYPNLIGNIPQEASLIFPKALPLYWLELKTTVIQPWLYKQTSTNPQDITLQMAIEDWLKQKT